MICLKRLVGVKLIRAKSVGCFLTLNVSSLPHHRRQRRRKAEKVKECRTRINIAGKKEKSDWERQEEREKKDVSPMRPTMRYRIQWNPTPRHPPIRQCSPIRHLRKIHWSLSAVLSILTLSIGVRAQKFAGDPLSIPSPTGIQVRRKYHQLEGFRRP